MFNPDYPTATNGGFIQHTYQPEIQNQSMFYSGFATNPYAQDPFRAYGNQCAPDSRRNFNMAPQAPAPQVPYGYAQPVQEQIVPFGSYPPATPAGNAAPTGLNALVESRRNMNMTTTPNNSVSNPWVNTTATAPVQQPQPVQMQNPMTQNPYANPYAYGYQVEPSVAALYSNEIIPFDKKTTNCWENQYTTNRPLDMPNVNWYTAPNYGYPQQNQFMTQQPQNLNPAGAMYNTASPVKFNPNAESYLDIAKKNWANL